MQDLHLCHCILLADWRSRTWFNLLDSQMLKQLGHTYPIVTVVCFQLCVGHDCSRNPFVGGGILFVCKPCLETRANECGSYIRHAHVVFMRFVYWNPNQARRVASVSLLLINIKKNARFMFYRACRRALREYDSVNSLVVCFPASLLTLITDLPVMSSIVDAKTGSARGG